MRSFRIERALLELPLNLMGRARTLELSEWRGEVWVKAHPLRIGEWATDFACELAELSG